MQTGANGLFGFGVKMDLKRLLENIGDVELFGSVERNINGIEFDSRSVKPGNAFVAQRGVHVITSYSIHYTKLYDSW